MVETNTELREKRKQWFVQMEQKLQESWSSKEDSLFYYHSSEDWIVLSHAPARGQVPGMRVSGRQVRWQVVRIYMV